MQRPSNVSGSLFVRASLFPAAAAALCLGLSAVHAAPRCADEAVFNVEALKSEMMVLATACHDDSQYNAFINRFQPELIANEHALDAYFKRAYGRQGQTQHDSFITNLANAQSDVGLKQGTDFCPRNATLFQEAMAVSSQELPEFAAGKDLVPATLATCETGLSEPSRAPARRVVRKVAGRK